MGYMTEQQRNRNERINKQLDDLQKSTLRQIHDELLMKHNLEDPNFLNNEGSRYHTFRMEPDVYLPIEFVNEHTKYGWRSEPNGKCRLYVGDYGDKQCFRTKKGTFDVPAIAHHIAARLKRDVENAKFKQALADEKRVYDNERAEIVSQYGLSEYTSTIESKSTGLVINLAGLSGTQAKMILDVATSLGVKL